MTRSHKYGDRDHTAEQEEVIEHLPRYFAKSGHVDADPKSVKKSGGGRGNWGRDGDEIEDYTYNMTNPRRRSNSFTAAHTKDFKSKFETIEPEPVFEEELHGPTAEDLAELEKASSVESSGHISVADEEAADEDKKA